MNKKKLFLFLCVLIVVQSILIREAAYAMLHRRGIMSDDCNAIIEFFANASEENRAILTHDTNDYSQPALKTFQMTMNRHQHLYLVAKNAALIHVYHTLLDDDS